MDTAVGLHLTSFLLSLKQTSPEASALLESLSWVQDGIGNPASGVGSWEVAVVLGLSDYWRLGPTGQELLLQYTEQALDAGRNEFA